MIRLRAAWNIPGDGQAERVDEEYFAVHIPAVRRLPGIARHTVLKFTANARGGHPWWWRGEELFFASREALEAAARSADWSECWHGRFAELISGPRLDGFAIVEEFEPASAPADGGAGPAKALSGIWQVPAEQIPAEVDAVYLDVHVPGVRRLPTLRRHTVMTSIDWPAGEHARSWRAAEIRFDSAAAFDAVFDTPEYEPIRHDGFNASVAGPDVDIYLIEEEWHA
jgi:uncharacterized protein (TIGR02118 family)